MGMETMTRYPGAVLLNPIGGASQFAPTLIGLLILYPMRWEALLFLRVELRLAKEWGGIVWLGPW